MPLPPLKPSLSPILEVVRILKGIFSFSFLFSLLLLCNLCQMLSAPLLLISRRLVRLINRAIGGFWWGISDWFAESLYGVDVQISGDPLPLKENVMVTANHQEMSDITTLFRLARRQGRIGDLKWFVKDVIKYVPGVGWGMIFLDCIFLKRDWKKDKERLKGQLSRFKEDQIPIWTLSFVEGTRITERKHRKSIAYAESIGVVPHKHLLIPRTKGFTLTLEALRDHLDAVYDATIGYVEGVPSLWQWCRGDVQCVALHVRRFPVETLPKDEEALAEWLKARWYEKDALLDYYYEHGVWPEISTRVTVD